MITEVPLAHQGRYGHAEDSDVQALTLMAGEATLSALRTAPAHHPPRATVIALHGAGMRAGYFDGQAYPGTSLLKLGTELGLSVVAIDRPGYGLSAATFPHGQSLIDQAATIMLALHDLCSRFDTGLGLFLHAHSFGGKLALVTAAYQQRLEFLGLDVSGCGHRYAHPTGPPANIGASWRRSWLPLDAYPPSTFRTARKIVAPIPIREQYDIATWESTFPDIAQRIRVPVRFTFAEYELWWRHDDDTLTNLRSLLRNSPRVAIDHQFHAGHNTSLGYTARAFHLRSLAFAEECLERRATGERIDRRIHRQDGTPTACGHV